MIKENTIAFAICGLIAAGKTTLVDKLEKYINNPSNKKEIEEKYPKLKNYDIKVE